MPWKTHRPVHDPNDGNAPDDTLLGGAQFLISLHTTTDHSGGVPGPLPNHNKNDTFYHFLLFLVYAINGKKYYFLALIVVPKTPKMTTFVILSSIEHKNRYVPRFYQKIWIFSIFYV